MPEPLVPVTLLTGFLGSGKTTVLNRLLKRPDMAATAVIVNEFGEVGLDHVLIERSSGDTVLLASGCICCTVRDDLSATLTQLMLQKIRGEIPDFRRVVIETTGLADPAPILHMLMTDPAIAARYRLGGVVATIDAVNGSATLDQHMEGVKQAAVADRLLITKTDIAPAAQSALLRERLAALNPGARLIDVVDGMVDPTALFDIGLYSEATKSLDVQNWLRAEAYRTGTDHSHACDALDCADPAHNHVHPVASANRHDHGIQSCCIVRTQPVPWEAFSSWLELLSEKRGDDLLRVKGIVNISERPGQPVVIHGVQRLFHPPVLLESWPSDDHRTRIVFITRNIAKFEIENTLRIFAEG
jgi:G3E family GTPase